MWDQNDPVKHSLKEIGSELSYRRATEDLDKERIRRPLRRDTKMALGMAIVLALAMVVAQWAQGRSGSTVGHRLPRSWRTGMVL